MIINPSGTTGRRSSTACTRAAGVRLPARNIMRELPRLELVLTMIAANEAEHDAVDTAAALCR
jgi:hypothetical protein